MLQCHLAEFPIGDLQKTHAVCSDEMARAFAPMLKKDAGDGGVMLI